MDPLTITMLVIGALGVLLVALSLLFGEFHLGDIHPDGPFSVPVVCTFVGAFGFIGAIPAALTAGLPTGVRVAISVAAGLVAAVPLAIGSGHLVRAASRMRTDPTLTSADLLGVQGVVITAIPAGGLGEVRLRSHGQDLKYYARSVDPLPAGRTVYVIDTPSPTSVEVVSTDPESPAQPEGKEPA